MLQKEQVCSFKCLVSLVTTTDHADADATQSQISNKKRKQMFEFKKKLGGEQDLDRRERPPPPGRIQYRQTRIRDADEGWLFQEMRD